MKQSIGGNSATITPSAIQPTSRSRAKQVMMSNQGLEHQNNSTENLFNLIQATKTKNTPMLEPLNKVSHKKNDSNNGSAFGDAGFISPKDEIGIGLKKSNRMQQTEYGHGFNSIPGPETQDQ